MVDKVKEKDFSKLAIACAVNQEISYEDRFKFYWSYVVPRIRKLKLKMIELGSYSTQLMQHLPGLNAFYHLADVCDFNASDTILNLRNYKSLEIRSRHWSSGLEKSSRLRDGSFDVSYTGLVMDRGSQKSVDQDINAAELLEVFARITKKRGISIHSGDTVKNKLTTDKFLNRIGFKLITTFSEDDWNPIYVFEKVK